MPLALTDAQIALLESENVKVRTLIDIYLDSGRVSIWDGGFNYSFDGTVYLAAAQFGHISGLSLGQDLGAAGVELHLNGTKVMEASPEPSDPAAIFGTIDSENYQLRRVHIHFAFFAADTGALVLKQRRYAGFIDQIRQEEKADNEGRMETWLVCSLESIARRYGVNGGRTRSHDDQQEIHAGDEFFLFTSQSVLGHGSVYWGRASPRVGSLLLQDMPYGFGGARKPRINPNVT